MVFDSNDSGISAQGPRQLVITDSNASEDCMSCLTCSVLLEDCSCLVHLMEFPCKDSTVSGHIPMTCGEVCSPIAHKTSHMCRHLLLMTVVKAFVHVLMHHWQTSQWWIQDLSVLHIKASFPIRLAAALHNNHADLNGLIGALIAEPPILCRILGLCWEYS